MDVWMSGCLDVCVSGRPLPLPSCFPCKEDTDWASVPRETFLRGVANIAPDDMVNKEAKRLASMKATVDAVLLQHKAFWARVIVQSSNTLVGWVQIW